MRILSKCYCFPVPWRILMCAKEERPEEIKEMLRKDAALKVFARAHPFEALRPYLKAKGFVTAEELKRLPHGTEVKIGGLVILVHTPPVRSGRQIMFVTLEDETGLIDLVITPEAQEKCAKEVVTKAVVFFKVRLQICKENKTVQVVAPSRSSFLLSFFLDKFLKNWLF